VDDSGRPGLGPYQMKPNDLVAVIAGAHMPCILREDTHFGRPRYRVVGIAYVVGLMDGEAFPDGASFEDIELGPTVF